MKKGKIIILLFLLILVTSITTVIVITVINKKITNDEIKESKYNIRTSVGNYMLTSKKGIDNIIADLEEDENNTQIDSSKILVDDMSAIEYEIDSASWCNTRNAAYNVDCNIYKEELKKFFKRLERMGELNIEHINDPYNDKILIEINGIANDLEKVNERFERKTQEFHQKTYK